MCDTMTLISAARNAGVRLWIIDGELKAAGNRAAVQEWAPRLREQKCRVMVALQDPAPLTTPAVTDWRPLARSYHAHHFGCPICIAAGKGRRYGLRCGAGTALWNAYSDASTRGTP